MLYNIIAKLDKKLHFPIVMGHCDIPCKIDAPISVQVPALTFLQQVNCLEEVFCTSNKNITFTDVCPYPAAETLVYFKLQS